MNRSLLIFSTFAFLVSLNVACRPELGQQKLPPKDEAWAQYLEATYPSWKRPPVVTPYESNPAHHLINSYPTPAGAIIAPEKNEFVNSQVPVQPVVIQPIDVKPPIDENVISQKDITDTVVTPPVVINKVDPTPVEEQDVLYTVKRGDSIWTISVKAYGAGKYSQKIIDANPQNKAKPNRLKVGQILKIPRIEGVPYKLGVENKANLEAQPVENQENLKPIVTPIIKEEEGADPVIVPIDPSKNLISSGDADSAKSIDQPVEKVTLEPSVDSSKVQ